MIVLKCSHCQHSWEDDLPEEVENVWCTRCGEATPLPVAQSAPPNGPAVPPRQPPPRAPQTGPPAAPQSPRPAQASQPTSAGPQRPPQGQPGAPQQPQRPAQSRPVASQPPAHQPPVQQPRPASATAPTATPPRAAPAQPPQQRTPVTPQQRPATPAQQPPSAATPQQRPSGSALPAQAASAPPAQQPRPAQPSASQPVRPAHQDIYQSMPTMHVGDSDPGDAPTIAPGATPTPAARTPHPTDVSEARTMAPSSAPPPEAATLAPSTAGFDRTSDGDDDPLVGRSLDGYQILRKLGAGGMGAVYTAHQSSLDRDVALKVLPPVFAARPDMVARFTREALSAAQLNHHNIIQVYDVGKDRGVNFITMELVEGKTLGELVRDEGRFPLEDAAGYVLQAARGLHYAHERGIIHRDIKPANLMLNRQGVLKIADMGLAKKVGDAEIEATIGDSLHAPQATDGTPITSVRSVGTTPPPIAGGAAAELTQASIAMGTPAYMAPEQGEDAARVDGRADQYSLGCTLYYLCTGRAPYTGGSAIELITKHKTEPLPALDADVPNVPPSFNRILQKMLAKNRNERYATFKDCIRELEAYLGIESEKGVYTPREHHLAVLESAVENFYAAPALKRRKFALYGFFGAMAVLAIATGIDWGFAGVGIIMALMLLTPLAHFVINGVATHDFLFNRVRGSLLGMRLRNWAIGAVGAAFGLGILWLVGWLPIWIGFGAAAVGLAFAYQFGVMRPLRAQREEPLQQMRDALKELRIKGVSEEALHDFVARFAPRRWEEFFEELFGYENMILARQKLAAAKAGRPRVKHATWREPIVRGIERLEQARREAKEQAELARVEQERLEAEGVSSEDAHKQAEEEAMRFRQEQLHKVAAKDVDWTQMQTTGSRRRLRLGTPMGRAIRALMGVAIIALWLLESQWGGMVTLPEQATSVLNTYVYAEGIGYAAYLYGLIAGICVLVSALSRRMFVPWLVALGAILLIFNGPIVNMVDNPDFNAWTSVLVAGGLIAFGIGTSVLAAATGKEF